MSMTKWTGSRIDHGQNCEVSHATPGPTHSTQGQERPTAYIAMWLLVLFSHCDMCVCVVCVCVIAATLEQIIRQERDNLVMKLNSVVQRYTRQVAD